ncbi:DNA repair protein rad50, partial [Ascosphaera pollenicola]
NYVQAGEGTNFILLHLWFHTLIVLLHQPTLLHSFGGQMQQLVPNTKSLSISSAKTIVDILAFAELIDAKSFIGNPFTSQPIYISACAFLAEQHNSITSTVPDKQHAAREFMITSSPQENYQKCYEALKSIKVYWEGCRYIITVLDQKAKGIVDPQLFTDEEWDGAVNEKETKSASSLSLAATRPPDINITPGQAIGWALTGDTGLQQPN